MLELLRSPVRVLGHPGPVAREGRPLDMKGVTLDGEQQLMKLPAHAPFGPAVIEMLERALETVKRPPECDFGILVHMHLRITKFHA
jgi:hypothetical protein